jgi:hypothetical protein
MRHSIIDKLRTTFFEVSLAYFEMDVMKFKLWKSRVLNFNKYLEGFMGLIEKSFMASSKVSFIIN